MRKRTTLLALAVLLSAMADLTAQQPPEVKAGPEHAIFKDAEGTWEAVIKSNGSESKGSQSYKVEMNGLWLLESFKGEIGGMTFEGRGATSYDPAKKKYVNVWIDSMSTSPMVSEGTYDKKTKTMTLTGNMPTPDGKGMKVSMVTVDKDANTKLFTLTGAGPDGKDVEMLQITYKRKVK